MEISLAYVKAIIAKIITHLHRFNSKKKEIHALKNESFFLRGPDYSQQKTAKQLIFIFDSAQFQATPPMKQPSD